MLTELAAAVRGINDFAFDLYTKLKAERGNVFLSPYSISTALAMTCGGARGNTAAEMERALHFTLGPRVHAAYGALIKELKATECNGQPRGYQLSVANRLFGAQGYVFLQSFLELNRNEYGAELQTLDFAPQEPAEASRKLINAWAEAQTQKKIPELIPSGAVDGALLVLVNAIYFKGDWAEQFDKAETANAAFQLSLNKQIQTPLMHKMMSVKYMEKAGAFQAIELPFKTHALSMVVILPAKDGLAEVESALIAENLNTWLGSMTEQTTAVALPKFKLTWGTKNLATVLKALGINDAFNREAANFSGMSSDPKGLFIAAVFHKAFVDVNEEGAEAAAATAVVMGPGGPPPRPKVFNVDRPFLFMIKDNASGAILFVGRVADPRG